MFPGRVPDSLLMSPRKMSDAINEALGPYFKSLLLKDLTLPNVYTSILRDNKKQKKKEMQVRVNFGHLLRIKFLPSIL